MKSIYVDWTAENICEVWDFVGARIVYEKELEKLSRCTHSNIKKGYCDRCECYPEDEENANYPMMNFAYPLFSEPDDDKIFKICTETNCTVVHNLQDDNYYLALTGCGMDLSQDIALAYIIADGCIDWDLLEDVNISGVFSVSQTDYRIILKKLKRQLAQSISNRKLKLKEVIQQLRIE